MVAVGAGELHAASDKTPAIVTTRRSRASRRARELAGGRCRSRLTRCRNAPMSAIARRFNFRTYQMSDKLRPNLPALYHRCKLLNLGLKLTRETESNKVRPPMASREVDGYVGTVLSNLLHFEYRVTVRVHQ